MNDKDIKSYASLYTVNILDSTCRAISSIIKQEFSHNFSREDLNTVAEEFLIYNMVACARLTFSWFGAETTNRIFENIFEEIGSTINENKEKILANKLDSLTVQNLSDYFESVSSINIDELRNTYNQRATEYAEYDLIREDRNKGKAGMLEWEFTEKLATLLNLKDNAYFFVFIEMIAMRHIGWLVSAREIWEKNR